MDANAVCPLEMLISSRNDTKVRLASTKKRLPKLGLYKKGNTIPNLHFKQEKDRNDVGTYNLVGGGKY